MGLLVTVLDCTLVGGASDGLEPAPLYTTNVLLYCYNTIDTKIDIPSILEMHLSFKPYKLFSLDLSESLIREIRVYCRSISV